MQVWPFTHQGIEEWTEFIGVSARRLVGPQPRPAMDVPGHDEDRALRLLDGLRKGGKVGCRVNEEGGARRRCNAPAVPSWYGYLMGGCERHPIGVIHTAFLAYRLLPRILYRTQAWKMTCCANVKVSKFYATGLDTSNGAGYGRLARWAGEETA